jgi:hypothetical protein
MRLRTAIKIQRHIEGQRKGCPWWRKETIWRSRTICRRHWQDRRVPYIPDDDELEERAGFFFSILADVLIDDPEEREKVKEQIWTTIEG